MGDGDRSIPSLSALQAAAVRSAPAIILAHKDHPAALRTLDAICQDTALCDRGVIRADEQREILARYLGLDFPGRHDADRDLLHALSASRDALLVWGLARTAQHLALLAGIVVGSRAHDWPITPVFDLWATGCEQAPYRIITMAEDERVPAAFRGAIIIAPSDPATIESPLSVMRLDSIDRSRVVLTPIDGKSAL